MPPLSDIAPRPGSRLVLHIGDHKTGSTAIQNAFASGAVRLHSGTVFYPGGMAHNFLRRHMKALANGSPKQQEARKALKQLARRIRKADADCALISAEALEKASPQVVQDASDTFFSTAADSIHVAAYVRPHLSRLLSSYTEQTKIGLISESLEEYAIRNLETGKFLYHPRFTAWRDAFGDAFILRPFLRDELHQGDVVADLLHHGFGETGFEITAPTPANESLCVEDLMRLQVLQSHMQQHPQPLRHALGWEFARLATARPDPGPRTRLQLHRTLAQRLHDAFLQDARKMDRDFFGGRALLETELERALENATAAPQALTPESCLSSGEIRSISLLGTALSGMLGHDSVNWVQHFRQLRMTALQEETGQEEVGSGA